MAPTKKKYHSIMEYLSKNSDGINLRGAIKAVREAFQNDELDIDAIDDAWQIIKGKGLVKDDGSSDAPKVYDFITDDIASFTKWFEDNKASYTSKSSGTATVRLSADELMELKSSDPEAYQEYRNTQKAAIKTYSGGAGDKYTESFNEVDMHISNSEYKEAQSKLDAIRTRKGSPNHASKGEYQRRIDDAIKQQQRDS